MEYLITGDKHSNFAYLLEDLLTFYGDRNPEELGIIILGDAGLNFYLNKTDEKKKAMLNNRGYKFYLVRGNHEARPEDLPNTKKVFDEEVKNGIYLEEEYPNIRYLIDGETYYFDKYKCLILGGGYSVDKEYRLLNHYPWFPNEQLDQKEMYEILGKVKGEHYDFILSHTCPISFESQDLFLPMIDQSKVDKSMENFLEEIEKEVWYYQWLFGHYHDDRLVQPGVEMFYHRIDNLDNIWDRWVHYDATGELPEGYACDPRFFDN